MKRNEVGRVGCCIYNIFRVVKVLVVLEKMYGCNGEK